MRTTPRNLADLISRRLLPQVRRPGQYVGLELNACCRDVDAAEVRVAMAFPDLYSIGVSHLGSQILYRMLNDIPGVACDRTYCVEPDAEAAMRAQAVPLFGWESRRAIRDFDLVGFSLGYEMCVTNVLTMLDLAGIPLLSADRTGDDPLIVGGDAMADTPEPIADFFDLFLPGDGEVSLPALVELIRRMKRAGASRQEIILEAARTSPSVYAPCFYRPRYGADGALAAMDRLREDVPPEIARAYVDCLSDWPALTAPLVPMSEGVHERVVIEVMRGCPNACRFCQAGSTRLPVRTRPIDEIVAQAKAAIAATGFREVSLLSLSTSDYPRLGELIAALDRELTPLHVSVSLPSLRVGMLLRELPAMTSTVRKGGLTIAAEAGSQRLRTAIRKNISEEDMIEGVKGAYRAGWRSVKVYFMAGLPGETDEDIQEICRLCRRLSDARKEIDNQKGSISAAVSWLVPKPHTPLQWSSMQTAEYFLDVRRRLKDLAYRTPVMFKFHRVERSVLEAVLCRGDRRVGQAILAAWRDGAHLDSWDEHFDFAKWLRAFSQTGIDPAFYAHRQIGVDEVLPWQHIRCPRSPEFLLKERAAMMESLQAAST